MDFFRQGHEFQKASRGDCLEGRCFDGGAVSIRAYGRPNGMIGLSLNARTFFIIGVPSWVRFCQQEFGEFPRLVGRYCSYLLQAGELPKFLLTKPHP